MYSVVLMAALAAGGEMPECHCRCGCCGYYGGCYGCYGGCYGCWGGGCYGGYGWGYGCAGCYGCWGGYAGWGCAGCYGGAVIGGYGGGYIMPTTPAGTPPEELKTKPKPDKGGMGAAFNRARLIVELPADAKLYIDDLPMKTASGTRTFNTPALEPGQSYYYMVKAEVIRDGKPVSQTRRVIVRAGATIRADFKDLTAEPVITVKAR